MHPIVALLSTRKGILDLGVLDLRDNISFQRRHVANSLHMSGIAGLRKRFSWLPPPKTDMQNGKELVVICQSEDEAELKVLLDRWNVIAFIGKDDEQFWIDVATCKDLLITQDSGISDSPAILFEPSPIIEPALQVIEEYKAKGATATVLDLGCGAGRDLAWIVNKKSNTKWLATGIDNLLPATERAKLLREEYHLDNSKESHIESLLWAQAAGKSMQALQLGLNSKSKGVPISTSTSLQDFAKVYLPHQTYDLVLFIRFFPFDLVKEITALTHENSIIAISHFTTLASESNYPSPDSSKRFEDAHCKALLQDWNSSWKVIHCVINRSEDGRPLLSVLFQRSV